MTWRQDFRGKGSSPYQYINTTGKAIECSTTLPLTVFSERELTFTFAILCCRPSVCRLSSVTLVHPTQAVQIFANISTAFGTLAIHGHPLKILRRSSQGNPSAGELKTRGVVKYSDFGPIDGYISETVQDRRQVNIRPNHL